MFRFGEFELDTGAFELRREGQPVKAEPRALELLCLLIENRDRVVGRDEIIEKLWNGRIVSEAAISTCLKSARRAIGDDGKAQALIKTVHGRGFRFVSALDTQPITPPSVRRGVNDLPSLIILPLQVFDCDPTLQAAADNLVETLTTVLTRIPLLSIVSRTASFTLKEQDIDFAAMRKRFGVWYMLEGSFQRIAAGVRANFQLIEAQSGHHLWARRIEYPDGLGLVDNLLEALVPLLEPQLVRAMMQDLSLNGGGGSARSLTLQATGVLSLKGWNRSAFEEAARLLSEALKLEPDLALAHAYLALVLGLGHRVGILADRDTLFPTVIQAADRAMELDGLDSTILGMTGCALADIGERDRAIPILRHALDLNPDNAQARTALGTVYLLAGRFAEANADLKAGIAASPMDSRRAVWGSALAMSALLVGDTEQAATEIEKARHADSGNHIPCVIDAVVQVCGNQMELARQALISALKIRPDLSERELKSLVGKGFALRLEPLLESARLSS
ncbi:winged helix-turn-helix domain-containing protein [uncultured Ruegeria sp.]|uniref:winged helix-turn-helix domain-containing tetratricopeptide repeat protein n=1 Tax=uncultured Ruegeria sp. TaxID=259304 RepID=UPI0026132B99|nr:winged helix-turn-helix domain-containing protein [uncultured Ruegeria sp.]